MSAPSLLRERIAEALQEGRGLAVGKLGSAEADMLYVVLNGHPYNGPLRTTMTVNAGLWPATNATMSQWSKHMRDAVLGQMDVLATWWTPAIETPVLDAWAPQAHRISLDDLDNFAAWVSAIPSGERVAVVTPFAASVARQASVLDSLFPTPIWSSPLPNIVAVRTGCSPSLDTTSPAAWSREVLEGGWQAAVRSVVQQVLATDARVALVGCGALSLPIVAALKAAGLIAIHTGGSTQVLFGIRGRRWEAPHPVSAWINECWIAPADEEKPMGYRKIEGGCYWV